MNRGEIRWYHFQPPDKRRPVLIITRDSVIPYLNEVTIAPITTSIRGIPSEVRLSVDEGMPEDCAINCDHLQTVSKSKLGRLIATLTATKMDAVASAVCFALGFDNYLA